MRKLILAMVLVMSTLTFAQDRKQGREKLTPEQQTELQVKKNDFGIRFRRKTAKRNQNYFS